MIDLQDSVSTHQIYLNKVGIKALKHPAFWLTKNNIKQTAVATFDMAVGLAADKRGTHMSRFVEILNRQECVLSVAGIQDLLIATAQRLKTDSVHINAKFSLFLNKAAPVSGATGYVDYDAEISGIWRTNKNQTHSTEITLTVSVPVTTLCPCSKEISDYGAHNQRSHIKLVLTTDQNVHFEELIKLIEREASCEIYSVIKRTDEKFITERAYDNPRFVEDMVRNIAHKINTNKNISYNYYRVESENIESIHNHSAYAMIESSKITNR